MDDATWADRAEVDRLPSNKSVLCVSASRSIFTVVRAVVPPPHSSCASSSSTLSTVGLHPLLYEFLELAFEEWDDEEHDELEATTMKEGALPVAVSALPFLVDSYDQNLEEAEREETLPIMSWAACPLGVTDLPPHTCIFIKILYDYQNGSTHPPSELQLGLALQDRYIALGSILLLPVIRDITSTYSFYMVKVESIHHESLAISREYAYKVYGTTDFDLRVIPNPIKEEATTGYTPPNTMESFLCEDADSPGYELVVQELVNLIALGQHSLAAPSGILLLGCAGVGKTRIASCAARLLNRPVHYVSVHDLVLQASWATAEDLRRKLTPPDASHVLILDNLDDAGEDASDSFHGGYERRLVQNSLLLLDEFIDQNVSVLGIGRDASKCPVELRKACRLEKEVVVLPPSQVQREQILQTLIEPLLSPVNKCHCEQWAELLATVTAGCVASDLRGICSDAFSRSLVLIEPNDKIQFRNTFVSWGNLLLAAQNCVPSQLAALDVTKPESFLEECAADDWLRMHMLSWEKLLGYSNVKKRLYRTTVVPWRRCLSKSLDKPAAILPPSGVLFYGDSGNGKTLAATCLGSSLGLPSIRVRSSDVLDKWLGGSEAAIRSLFARARAAAPSILFFDEIDSIASNRATDTDGDSSTVMSRLLSTLLNEMDGVSSGTGPLVLVVACTNRLESLDAALLRPGRLEEHVQLTRPTEDDITTMLRHFLMRAPIDADVDLQVLAKALKNHSASGAEVEGTCREAVFRALRRCTDGSSQIRITKHDIRQAINALNL